MAVHSESLMKSNGTNDASITSHYDNGEESELLQKASAICTLVMILMCTFGIVGNSLSLYIYRGPAFRTRSINVLLAALSASDLCLCLLAIPVFSISQVQLYLPSELFM
ncbi:hypothetical protein AB6A40_006868 [Gnathostoma spinigerum]|uniref:G-protein coupled receptors family 1 profile domain-containing protein n=1 Tax=Gnathostoma spinigerum TaxID=75299 RepID=A0ABD6EJL5_9BILA